MKQQPANNNNAEKTQLYVIITVDVESSDSPQAVHRTDLLNCMVYGQVGTEYWGFPRIIEICDKYNCPATFFVSVFEYKKYGEESWREVCAEIKRKRHDVQLHCHPLWAYGKRYMHEFSLEEQREIVRAGKQLLEGWIDDSPVAYRGGAYYSINADTFAALKSNGIAVDSTVLRGQPQCKVTLTPNKATEVSGIVELPISVCQVQHQVTLGPLKYKGRPGYAKVDLNVLTLDQLLWFVDQAKKHNLAVMTLFLHSYSLVKFDPSLSNFQPDPAALEKFDKFLSIITGDSDIKIITIKQFYELYRSNPEIFTQSPEYVPVLAQPLSLSKAMRHVVLSRKPG